LDGQQFDFRGHVQTDASLSQIRQKNLWVSSGSGSLPSE
jgi:hypothetical protein